MKITYFHLCDYAILSREGKLSVLGIWSAVNVRKLPHVLPQAFLAFEIELNYAEVGIPLKIEIKCVDADGNPAFGAQAEINLGEKVKAKPGDRPRIGQVLGLTGLRFTRAGAYDVNVFLNGNLTHQEAFEVRMVPPPAAPPPPGTPPAGQ